MKKITTWNDILSLQNNGLTEIYQFIAERYKQLYQIYCPNNLIVLAEFSLMNYGEMYIVDSYAEVSDKIFESVEKYCVNNITIFMATFVANNSTAIDFIIDSAILTPTELENIEKEV